MNTQRLLAASLMMASFLFCGNAWSAQAGLVQFVHGNVTVTDLAGASRVAHKGDAINEGDTLVSAQDASAQIRMDDGGFIAVRPNTRLKFDKFKFTKQADKPESALFSLFKGGFRAITGLIGRIRHEDYKITTPVATIGIRGTDHETVMVLPGDPLVLAGEAVAGAYNRVNVGETTITTNRGTVTVLPNQMGFAGGLNQMPQIQPVNPNLFTVTPPPAPNAQLGSGGASGGDSGTRDTSVVDTVAQVLSGDTSGTGSVISSTAESLLNAAPPSVVTTVTQTLTATTLSGAMGLFYTDASGTWTTGGSGTIAPIFDASGGLSGFTVTSFSTCTLNCAYNVGFSAGTRGTASLLESGGDALAGNIHWGRWLGSGATVTGLPAGATFHNSNLIYIGGDVPTMPVTGAANYVPIGGTSPVDAAGTKGTFLGASVSVDFGLSEISVSNMKVSFPTGAYAGTYTMNSSPATFQANGLIPSIPLTGSCNGQCGTALPASGDIAGSFTGANAAGLALGYHITVGAGGAAAPQFEMMGAQGFVKQ